jgi:hypothetical protein
MHLSQLSNSNKFELFKSKDRVILFAVGFYAFFLSLVLSFFRGFNSSFSQDSKDYISGAENLQNGLIWMFNNPDQFAKPLGLPFQVLVLKIIFGSSWLVIYKIIAACLHAITAALVIKICQAIGVRRNLSFICGLLFASDPLVIFSTTDLTTETIATLTITFWSYWALMKIKNEKISKISKINFIILSSLCIATRPNYLFILLSILILLVIKNNIEVLKSIEIISFSAILCAFQVFVCLLYKSLILLAPGSGLGMYFFCRGNLNQQAVGLLDSERNASINSWVLQSLTNQNDIFFSRNPESGFVAFNQYLSMTGLKYCLDNPSEGLVAIFLRAVGNWRPFVAFGAYGVTTFLMSLLVLGTLLVGTIIFILRVKSKLETTFMHIFLVASAAFTLSILVTPTQIRHRISFSESLMWICCAIVINRLLSERQERAHIPG